MTTHLVSRTATRYALEVAGHGYLRNYLVLLPQYTDDLARANLFLDWDAANDAAMDLKGPSTNHPSTTIHQIRLEVKDA